MSLLNNRFEGWYFKHQHNGKSLALIPGRASDGAFVLVVTDKKSYHVKYPLSEYRLYNLGKGNFCVHVGGSKFSPSGIILDVFHPELTITGELSYKNLIPIRSDIMGPFKYFPMECRHGIVSMNHFLCGMILINDEVQDFTGGKGYIESDSGRSFPSGYTWIHCNDFSEGVECSIMASVAKIPFYGIRFLGCICVVWLNGYEYRLATYNGVKILYCKPGVLSLKQGKYQLDITVEQNLGHKLPAPHYGKMSHFIRETLSCPAWFRFTERNHCLFEGRSDYASYEYMM